MPHINLLPWRGAQRQQQKKNYLTLLVGIGVSMVLLMFAVSKGMDQVIALRSKYGIGTAPISPVEHFVDLDLYRKAVQA